MTHLQHDPKPPSSGPVRRLLRAVAGRQRAHERKTRGTGVYLFTASAFLGEATVVDESDGGAKIKCSSANTPALARYALNPTTGQVQTLGLAWQAGKVAGFRYTDSRTIRGYLADQRLQHVRDFWAENTRQSGGPPPRGMFGR